MPLKLTPQSARIYLLCAAFIIALPSIMKIYNRYEEKFLVSTALTEESPFFKKSVIYISKHNAWGTEGIIINKPLDEEDREELSNTPPGFAWHIGGPLGFPQMKFVILDEIEITNLNNKKGLKIVSLDQYIKTHTEEWEDILNNIDKKKRFKIYLGYAGWGIWQLEKEIRWGAWGIIDFDRTLLQYTTKEELWPKAMKQVLKSAPPKNKTI